MATLYFSHPSSLLLSLPFSVLFSLLSSFPFEMPFDANAMDACACLNIFYFLFFGIIELNFA